MSWCPRLRVYLISVNSDLKIPTSPDPRGARPADSWIQGWAPQGFISGPLECEGLDLRIPGFKGWWSDPIGGTLLIAVCCSICFPEFWSGSADCPPPTAGGVSPACPSGNFRVVQQIVGTAVIKLMRTDAAVFSLPANALGGDYVPALLVVEQSVWLLRTARGSVGRLPGRWGAAGRGCLCNRHRAGLPCGDRSWPRDRPG